MSLRISFKYSLVRVFLDLLVVLASLDLLDYLGIVLAGSELLLEKLLIVVQFGSALHIVVADVAPVRKVGKRETNRMLSLVKVLHLVLLHVSAARY